MVRNFIYVVAFVFAGFCSREAGAELIYGLTTAGQLFSFDSLTPANTSSPILITGRGSDTIVAIDFRPATGQLYGLGYNPASGSGIQLYTINPQNAVATAVGRRLPVTCFSGSRPTTEFAFNFDPAADRARVVTGNADNFHARPLSQTHERNSFISCDTNVSYAPGDPHFGFDPDVTAIAYSNNQPGTTQSTLYGYDFGTDRIVRIGGVAGNPSPDGGSLFTIGPSGILTKSPALGMDISASTGTAYLSADVGLSNDNLYTVNLGTGAVTLIGPIGSGLQVLDIAAKVTPPAILPEQTFNGPGLPVPIRESNSNTDQATTFEAVYSTAASIFVDVSDPSPSNLKIVVFPGELDGFTSRPPVDPTTGLPIVPIYTIWDHESVVNETGGPIPMHLKTTVMLPATFQGMPLGGRDHVHCASHPRCSGRRFQQHWDLSRSEPYG